MSELKKVSEIQVGDTIDTLYGYVYKVVKIEEVQKPFSTPERILTVYTNIDDDKKLYEKTYSVHSYLTVVNDYVFPEEQKEAEQDEEYLELYELEGYEFDMDEQLPEYHILNLSECGREWIEGYQIPEGYETSEYFMEWKEANAYIKYLKDLQKDPSFMVSILGYYIYNDHSIQVVFKVQAIS